MKFRKLIPIIIPYLWIIYNGIGKLIRHAGDVDFIIERTQDIAWIGGLMKFLTHPIVLLGLAVFGLVWIYKIVREPKSKKQKALPKQEKDFEEKLIKVNKFKWQVEIFKNGVFKIDEIPYCLKHNLRLIDFKNSYHCPNTYKCGENMEKDILRVNYDAAYSNIEKRMKRRKSSFRIFSYLFHVLFLLLCL